MSLNDSQQILELLESQPWEDIIPRLLVHASKKSKRLFWRGIYGGHLPDGKEVEDLVNEAIEKVLTGLRQWNPIVNPDFFAYLRSIVDSDLNHLADCLENRVVRPDTLSVATDCDDSEQEVSIINNMPAATPSPEEVLLQQEELERCEQFFLGFHESLANKPMLQKIVECIWDDWEKPADIADRLGVQVGEVYNARKQLQRRLDEYRKA